jgi:tRNA pseudouridine13 synthase
MTNNYNQLFPTINKISATGVIRKSPEDFKVTEITDIEFSGQGEHLWLYIEKIGTNTDWLSKQLAKATGVPPRNIGYAGLKDRHAVTQQWFSVQLPKVDDVELIQSALPTEIKILESAWHSRKLKTGQLDYNHFEIIIRDIEDDKESIELNIEKIKKQGVPNYFGSQRFGQEMGNIQKSEDWFNGNYKVKTRNLKSLLLSTARSLIFNNIVAERIRAKIWNQSISGDILQLDNSHSWFPSNQATDNEIKNRLSEFDIHLTAALWGEDKVQSSDACAELETKIASQFPVLLKGLSVHRLKQDRRAMRIYPLDLCYDWQDNNLRLKFKLLPGSYATTIIREIVEVKDESNSTY